MSSTTNYNKEVDNNNTNNNNHTNNHHTNNYHTNYNDTNYEYIFNNTNNNITANNDFWVNDVIYATNLWQKINNFFTKKRSINSFLNEKARISTCFDQIFCSLTEFKV